MGCGMFLETGCNCREYCFITEYKHFLWYILRNYNTQYVFNKHLLYTIMMIFHVIMERLKLITFVFYLFLTPYTEVTYLTVSYEPPPYM